MAREESLLHGAILIEPEVDRALKGQQPVVALESALVTHGLPYPRNIEMARKMEAAVREESATPATIAVLAGRIHVGLSSDGLATLAQGHANLKLGTRDLARAIVESASGGTTVAATMFVASRVGITVFATGGIGGVHREDSFDISQDLRALAETPMIVVCAGAKAILNLEATLEYLETIAVPVIGYQTDEFPAFYSRESGLQVGVRLDHPQEVAKYWRVQQLLGFRNAILIVNPIPHGNSIPRDQIEPLIARASQDARNQKIQGQALTPFLLDRVRDLSSGRSMEANEALLLNNARLAAKVATALANGDSQKETRA